MRVCWVLVHGVKNKTQARTENVYRLYTCGRYSMLVLETRRGLYQPEKSKEVKITCAAKRTNILKICKWARKNTLYDVIKSFAFVCGGTFLHLGDTMMKLDFQTSSPLARSLCYSCEDRELCIHIYLSPKKKWKVNLKLFHSYRVFRMKFWTSLDE